MATVTRANGNKISFGDMAFSTLKTEIIMKEASLMEALRAKE